MPQPDPNDISAMAEVSPEPTDPSSFNHGLDNSDPSSVAPGYETPDPADPVDVEEPEVFSAEYVRKLREESAAHRVKSKKVTDANVRLVAAYAGADGRLVDVDALAYSEDMLDADGLVDRDRVADAIGGLIAAKPYLASRRPSTLLPQGVREDVPPDKGLFSLIRERV